MQAWVAENSELILVLVAGLIAGMGYLLRRRITGERHREHAESIEKAVNLKRLLDAEGMTVEDAIVLRDRLRSTVGPIIDLDTSSAIAVEGSFKEPAPDHNDELTIPFKETTVGMGYRLHAEFEEFDLKIRHAVSDLALVCSPARETALHKADRAWKAYRDREAEFAALLFEGGTGAPLLGTSRKIELSKERLEHLRLAREEITDLTGE